MASWPNPQQAAECRTYNNAHIAEALCDVLTARRNRLFKAGMRWEHLLINMGRCTPKEVRQVERYLTNQNESLGRMVQVRLAYLEREVGEYEREPHKKDLGFVAALAGALGLHIGATFAIAV